MCEYATFTFLILLLGITIELAYSACSIPFETTPKYPAIILSSGSVHTLFKPQTSSGDTPVTQDELTLACTGSGNAIASLSVAAITLECQSGSWMYDGQPVSSFLGYECSRTPVSSVQSTGQTCAGSSGDLLSIGFDDGNGKFAESYRICYDSANKAGIYSHHVINGAVGQTPTSSNRNFRTDETFLHPNAKYNVKATQKATFDNLLGPLQKYVNTGASNFFAVGHYAPVADFEYEYEQIATNYLINAAPQYQGFNGVNWLSVENLTRKKAWDLGTNIEVYTGSLDLLQLPNQTGTNVYTYLDTSATGVQVTVPKYFFKVVIHGNEAIALVGLNNIVEPEIAPDLSTFCNNLCPTARNFPDMKKGKVICCDLNDFMLNSLVQNTLPPLSATGVLNGFF